MVFILNLSSPEGYSVNNGIPKPPFSVQYITVDSLIEGIMARGQGTLMAKFGMVSANLNLAIHPQDHYQQDHSSTLGNMEMWCDKYYVDMALPFGLHCTQYIFTAIADMVQWMLC